MLWVSITVPPAVIPPSAWYYATPIAGSPFESNILPRELGLRNANDIYIGKGFSPALAKANEHTQDTNYTQA